MKRLRPIPLLLLPMLLAAGCGDETPVSPSSSAGPLTTVVETTGGVRTLEGETGPGAKYALAVPEDWNGRLVLYSHGYRDPETPVDLRDQDNLAVLRERLIEEGYAIGYSSYSENGFAVKDGMQRTQQLRGIFASEVGQPSQILLMGHSLGGLIALGLAERFPQHYAGALVMCGIGGGSAMEVNYIASIRVLFDFFYPGVLPGNLLSLPAGTVPQRDIEAPAVAAMTATLATGSPQSMQGAFAIAALMEGMGTPIPFIQTLGTPTTIETLVGSIVYALSFHARGFQDLIDRTHGQSPFDNRLTVYSGALPPSVLAAVNAPTAEGGVQRFSTTPAAQNHLRKYYQPSGNLQIPLVTLNNPFDPISPRFHMTAYRGRVAAAGRTDLLVERATASPFAYGHCAMTVDETMSAFADLAARVAD
jgi:pimeloyl-ACP methyl ester carboxylesterase